MANTPGLNFRLNKKKYSFSLGSAVAFTNFEQKNISVNNITDYNFVNFLPRASYQYKIKPNEGIRITYNGSNNAPTPEQLQPTRVNTDPLNIYIGNPNLKQSFRHNISTSYNFYNVLKEKGLWVSINFNSRDNAFVQSSVISGNGKRTYQTVNTNGIFNTGLNANYNMKIKDAKWELGLGPTFNLSRSIDFVNNLKNVTKSKNYGLRVSLNQHVPEKFNFGFDHTFSWNQSEASVNKSANAKYWSLEIYGSATAMFPNNFELGSSINSEYRQKDPRFNSNNNYTKLNAHLIKRF